MSQTAETQPESAASHRDDALLWIVRIAAVIGLLISVYLLYIALSGQVAVGCGEGDAGCGHVLGTRWSKVLGVPVSGPAAALYLIVLAASLHGGSRRPESERRGAWRVMSFCGLAAGGSALWFIGLQLFELGHICPYCMGAHGCSLVLAGATLVHGPRRIALPALVLPATLIALQLAFPPTVTGDEATRITGINPADWPTLGDPKAPHVAALLFDYNCGHCLVAHDMLADAVQRYPGQLCVVLLPTAIDTRINEHVTNTAYVSQTTPEIARLALAVWLADPSKLADFDAYLVQRIPRSRADGIVPLQTINTAFRDKAIELVGEPALDAALSDPRIDEMFKHTAGLYKATPDPATGNPGVPRIIIAGIPYGGIQTPDQLDQVLQASHPDLIRADE